MRFPQFVLASLLFFALPGSAFAAVGVTSSELQSAKDLLWPSGEAMGTLPGYSDFKLQESLNLSSGIQAEYEARLLDDPWLDEELPHVKITVYSYSDQDSAHAAFNEISELEFEHLISSDDHQIFYRTNTGEMVDVFDSIDAEHFAYHLVHVNGNLLYQSSLFRPDEGANIPATVAYDQAIRNTNEIYSVLYKGLDTMKVASGLLFPPTNTELSTKSDSSHLNLSSLYEIPQHGEIELDLYVGEIAGALGTLLDSSGISSPEAGDLYLYINDDGRLFAGIYAPLFDSNCPQQAGWYRIESAKKIQSYEWNHIGLKFGVGGLEIRLNDETVASCHVSQPYSGKELFFGDYPHDSIEESMIGLVNDLTVTPSTTDSGLLWDEVLTEQLFLDLPNSDPDVHVFQFLKERGIFLGSDGVLNPDAELNRAEMVKVLLKSYDYKSEDESPSEFWDVPQGAWYIKYLNRALKIDMVKGHDDGSFLPGHRINRAEFFTMIYRLVNAKTKYDGEFYDVDKKDWYAKAAAFAYEQGIIRNVVFSPGLKITRREAAHALYTLLK